MATNFTTTGLSDDAKISFAQKLVSDAFVNIDLQCADRVAFMRQGTIWNVGSMAIGSYAANGGVARHTRSHVARERSHKYLGFIVRYGNLSLSQFGRTALVKPGQFCLLDGNEPYEFSRPTGADMIALSMPAPSLADRLQNARGGISKIVADLLNSIMAEADELGGPTAQRLGEHIADLLALSLTDAAGNGELGDNREIGESSARHALYRRARAHIDENLGSLELTPQAVADALGISLRYLYRIFSDAGLSVADHVRTQRLVRARVQLGNILLRHRSVASIAYGNGFRNPAHFAVAFKREFGMTPTEARGGARRRI